LFIAYNPSKEEYCGKFNDYIPSLPRAIEVHGIQPNEERIKECQY
jgi:hypothetical protein